MVLCLEETARLRNDSDWPFAIWAKIVSDSRSNAPPV